MNMFELVCFESYNLFMFYKLRNIECVAMCYQADNVCGFTGMSINEISLHIEFMSQLNNSKNDVWKLKYILKNC